MTEDPAASSALLCALVVAPSAGGLAEAVIVAFPNPHEADDFAIRHGLDARVMPLRFAVQMDREQMGLLLATARARR